MVQGDHIFPASHFAGSTHWLQDGGMTSFVRPNRRVA